MRHASPPEVSLCRQNHAQRHCVSHDLRCPLGRRNQTAQRHCVSHEKGLAVGKPLKLVHIVKREGIVRIAITGEILRCG